MNEKNELVSGGTHDLFEEAEIYQANPLIEACRSMDLNEGRLFYLGLMLLRPQLKEGAGDTEFKEVSLSARDVIKLFGNKKYYSKLVKISAKLQSRIMSVQRPDGIIERINIFRKMSFGAKDFNGLAIKFNEDMAPYLLRLYDKPYTKIAVKHLFTLSTTYAPKLLELMLEHQNMPLARNTGVITREFTVEELRRLFNIPKDKYQQAGPFNRYVVDTAVDDISKSTPYVLTVQKNKVGNRIASYIFSMRRTQQEKSVEDESVNELVDEVATRKVIKAVKQVENSERDSNTIVKLVEYGVGRIIAKKITKTYSIERIENNIKYVEQKRGIKNKGAYLAKAIREDYYAKDLLQKNISAQQIDIFEDDVESTAKKQGSATERVNEMTNWLEQVICKKKVIANADASRAIASSIVERIAHKENLSATMESIIKRLNMNPNDIREYIIFGNEFRSREAALENDEAADTETVEARTEAGYQKYVNDRIKSYLVERGISSSMASFIGDEFIKTGTVSDLGKAIIRERANDDVEVILSYMKRIVEEEG